MNQKTAFSMNKGGHGCPVTAKQTFKQLVYFFTTPTKPRRNSEILLFP